MMKGLVNFDTVDSKELSFGTDMGLTASIIDEIALQSLKGAPGLTLSPKRLSILTSKQKLSVMPTVLEELRIAFDKCNQSCSILFNKTSQMTWFDVPNDFANIYCFIEFVYALPSIGQTLAHRQISGDGILWAGCTFNKLMQSEEKHSLLSYLNHLSYTRSVDKDTQLSEETDGVVIMSNYIKHVTEQLYDYLQEHVPKQDYKTALVYKKE